MVRIRAAGGDDGGGVWAVLEPVIRAGEAYPLARGMSREAALGYWFSAGHEVFVAEGDGVVLGTYYLRPNQAGGGAHVANCGYMVAASAMGRGVARAMCADSLERARSRGFLAMQFNFVVSTNERAVRLWERCGFEIVGRLPGVFLHPLRGYVDVLVMYQSLSSLSASPAK